MTQPVAGGPAPDERVRYLAEFLRAAWGGVNTMFTDPPCRIESFTVDGEDVVYAETVGHYRGHRWRFRRQVWPSSHPPLLAAQLYTTSLEERLNTRPLPPGDNDVELLRRPAAARQFTRAPASETAGGIAPVFVAEPNLGMVGPRRVQADSAGSIRSCALQGVASPVELAVQVSGVTGGSPGRCMHSYPLEAWPYSAAACRPRSDWPCHGLLT